MLRLWHLVADTQILEMKERKKLSNALLGSAEMVGEKLGSGHPEAAYSVGRSPASMLPAGCPHPHLMSSAGACGPLALGWVSGASGGHSSACPDAGDLVKLRLVRAEGLVLHHCSFPVCFSEHAASHRVTRSLRASCPLTVPVSHPSFPVAAVCIHSVSCTLFFNVKLFRVLKMSAFKINIHHGVQHISVFWPHH